MLNQRNSSCRFADELVSYLYGEIEANEKIKFEKHLKDCFDCQSEFEGFQFTRASILEWRDEEFSYLPLPSFEVSTKANLSTAESGISRSWFAVLRNLFSFNPAYAMALAIAVVGIGVSFYALNFTKNTETAHLQVNKIIEKPVVSPTKEVFEKPRETFDPDKNPDKKSSSAFENINPVKEQKRETVVAPIKAAVKVPAKAAKSNSDNQPIGLKESNDKKSSPVKKRQAPNLNQIEDEEDQSIRLADLFAELDTK